jgi:succinate dehydrogenase/fumarate reductase flavoprotein subunit
MSKLISMYWKRDKPELTYPGGKDTVLNCDIVVIGGGGSGLAAAVRAAEAGADVIIVEKMSSLGGNSRLAGGLLSTYSRFQKELGMPDKTNDYIEKAYKQNKYTLNPAIFRRYIGKTGSTLEWLVNHGMNMENVRWIMDAVCLIKNRTEDSELENPAYGPGLMGTAVVDTLTANMERLGVRVLLQTKARRLLRGKDGSAAGILADGQKECYRIESRAVILASGGFSGNPEMLRRFLPEYFTTNNVVSHYSLKSATGDAIAMGEEAGAEIGKNVSVGMHALAHIPGTYTMMSVASQSIGTVVNLNGRRFIAEDDTEDGDKAVDMQPEGIAWFILDSECLEECMKAVVGKSRYGDRMPDQAEFERNMAAELQVGWMVKGETLEDLAKKTGCEPSALKTTVSRCNVHYDTGFDHELFKKKENLRPIRTAPFYALRLQRNFDVTMGGISVNENTQALRPDQSVIPGLYVTGDIASNWMGPDYGPVFSSFAWAINSGIIAGDEAVARMITKVMDCDLAVIGAGGSGLVAAVKASEDGVRKVIILEKARKPGGATYFAGGPGVGSQRGGGQVGTQTGAGRGSGDVTGQFSSWFAEKVGPENFVKAARMEKYKDLPDPSIGPGRGGTFAVEKMVEFCRKQGIQILYESPARKFFTDTEGKVTRILADTKEGKLLINCKVCVIASGGFGSNYEKLKKHWPVEFNHKKIHCLCPPGMMGDGIDMAEESWAYIDQTRWPIDSVGGFFSTGPAHHPYSWSIMFFMMNGMLPSINLDGKRWMNESGFGGVSLGTQPGGVAYAVADNNIIETIGSQMERGNVSGPGGMTISPDSAESRAIKRWRKDIEYETALDEEGARGNHIKKADTLVELAIKMDLDPTTFVETIERYNRFCDAGKDLDFGKPAQHLKPIRKPPFYAFFGQRWSQCTKGQNGIAVNSKFEVLNPKGEALPGLYAAGDTCTIFGGLVLQGSARPTASTGTTTGASGVSGGKNILSTEPSPCGGSMAALMSGYSAGVHVAEFLKKV